MKIASAWSTHTDTAMAATAAYSMLSEKLGAAPQLMLVHSSCLYESATLLRKLRALAPATPIHGGTSCFGVLTEAGFHSHEGRGLGILGLHDPHGGYGVALCDTEPDVEAATISALDQALAQAGRPGEVPAVILIANHPGQEEHVIRAIEKHIGAKVPIIGGTAADNDMSGQWQQFANDRASSQAVSVATLFPSSDIGYAFLSGYEPTPHRGRATRTEGRILYEIDHQPAARVYNAWTNGLITQVLPAGGSLVPTASLSPLGNPVGQVGEIPYFRLSYPVEVLPDQALLLFTDVQQGSELVLMTGTHDSLASRAGRVAAAALDAAPFSAPEVEGALLLFCTGCMLVVQDRLDESVSGLRTALHDAPFVCAFTLGEQGCFIGGENRHANLMIAALVFGPLKAE